MRHTGLRDALSLALGSATLIVATVPDAYAGQPETAIYALPAQALGQSLRAVALASGRNILVPASLVRGLRAPALKGDYTVERAVALLLAGTGLRARVSGGTLIVETEDDPLADAASDRARDDIVVTGSRIRGAPVASPVIVVDRQSILDSGRATLPDALRALPQNFGGGQNPGIGFNVPEANGGDVGGGASINLRGLGSDATLTLLNGHRLSYNAAKQSIDISTIPLGAVDRVDVVPDGASALFGSDAVAGVVNIILRRDLDGLETSARLGGATDGGGFSQLYGATAGKTWGNGNALLAYEHGSNGAITAGQRDYAATRSPGLTLFPAQRHHSVIGSGRQAIVDTLTLAVDGTFNKRWTDLTYPLAIGGNLAVSRGTTSSVTQSFGVSPSLSWTPASSWDVMLSGTYGQDRVDYGGETVQGGVRSVNTGGYYRNRARSIELSTNGKLFSLPGGAVKVALGAGHRRIDFRRFTGANGVQNIDRSQADTYGFGELSLPLVGRDNAIPLVDSLTLSAAVRYEDYRRVAHVATPKFGVIYAPTADVSLKGSWGKSFRAATLYQQYQPQTVYLTRTTTVGGQGYPATATALLTLGGNPGLKPERSTNWSATLDLHPRGLEGFGIEASYFSVDYRDRIVTPIPSVSSALSNPAYAGFVTLNPDAATQADVLAGAGIFTNLSGATAYSPANVVALVRNNSVNAGRQSVRGVDVLAHYGGKLGPGRISASANAAYLESQRQIGPALPVTQLAGLIFNPSHWRLRGDLGWTVGPITATANVTHIGPVTDNRTASSQRIDGMTPVDFTLRYKTDGGVLGGLDIIASVQNLFNAEPAPIATTLPYDTPYDSTNYSPLGRFVSLSVSKPW